MMRSWPPLGPLEFARYEGLGNDYLVIDSACFGSPLTAATVIWLCDRHLGVGADGILLRQPRAADGAHVLRIFNPDGSRAEKSGNGLRIFARFLREFGYAAEGPLVIDTPGGRVVAELHEQDGGIVAVTVAMGQARFDSAAVHVAGRSRSMLQEPMVVDGVSLDVTCVSMGNPHCVVFRPNGLDVAMLRRLGPRIETHRMFTQRTNVQFAHVVGRRSLELLIWERGAGETQASGSSSCAAAAAAVRRGLMQAGAPLDVRMNGGTLSVTVSRNFAVTLRGPAEPICRGTLLAAPPLPPPETVLR